MTTERTRAGAYKFLIFFASFLLFAVEPIIAKYILPWFGGSPSVWITALLFFQVLLLAGYAYANLITRLRLKYQFSAYLIVVALAIVLLPIIPQQPKDEAMPALSILFLLASSVGLPYFILSATSPLLQAWSNAHDANAASYRLYAWSNFGSLLGLLSYPVLVEPFISVHQQALLWSILFISFGIALAALAIATFRSGSIRSTATVAAEDLPAGPRPTRSDKAWWIILSFAASVLLLAVTNYITQDIASVPLLWIVPLSIYLISFIVTFQSDRFYDRNFFMPLFLYASLMGALIIALGSAISNIVLLATILLLLGVFCLVCNGELYALRPSPRYLTTFYLWISVGGAAGGAFVALLAPIIFPLYFEFHFGICFTLLALIALWQTRRLWQSTPRSSALHRRAALIIASVVLISASFNVYQSLVKPTYVHRDFFGSLKIEETNDYRSLYHGKTLHGMQFKRDDLACWPTTYYGYTSGLGKVAQALQSQKPVHLGVVGLGAGTAAIYGDSVRFYELSPAVAQIATTQFSFLNRCTKHYDIVLGDARISLQNEPPQHFDLLVLDAFSSDSIPVHLLTAEAFQVYLRHLAPGGVIAVHISNKYLDFEPIIGGIAQKFNLQAAVIDDSGESNEGVAPSTWGLLTNNTGLFKQMQASGVLNYKAITFKRRIQWTDTKSNILSIFKLY